MKVTDAFFGQPLQEMNVQNWAATKILIVYGAQTAHTSAQQNNLLKKKKRGAAEKSENKTQVLKSIGTSPFLGNSWKHYHKRGR